MSSSPSLPPPPPPHLLTLPPELVLLITSHLPYPDALSFKHASPRLYPLVPTTVRQRVAWLVDRGTRGLVVPTRKCMLKTDASFCSSAEVRRIMEVRRRHGECGRDGRRECEVFVGRRCESVRGRGMGLGRRGRGLMARAVLADEKSVVILPTLMLGLAVLLLWMRALMLGNLGLWPKFS